MCSVSLWSTYLWGYNFLFSSLFCCLPLAKGEQDTTGWSGRHEQIALLCTGTLIGAGN